MGRRSAAAVEDISMSEMDPSLIAWLNQVPHAALVLGLVYIWRRLNILCARIKTLERDLNNERKHIPRDSSPRP